LLLPLKKTFKNFLKDPYAQHILFLTYSIEAKFSRSDIFRQGKLSVWQIPVFCYSLLGRNRGYWYIELETLEKQCGSYLKEYYCTRQ
jgi:hypothetical protein